ncbi:hypothetical protein [Streptomyces sp. Da 82-17]|uniref:hypothetical protein n=1 Tax=Streptomyces sp. Da 82-17 TaxID=3377116 RepID=UPI0038D357E8
MPRPSVRAVCAVLAAVAVVEVLRRHQRRLERALTAERAGHRLLDQVVHRAHVAELHRLRRPPAGAPCDPNCQNSQKGGLT